MALSASDKDTMPLMALDQFYNYVNVTRRTEGSSNDLGEPAVTWPAVTNMSNVKADIQPASTMGGDLKQILAGLEVESSHVVFFLSTADIQADDRIETKAGGGAGSADTRYRVDAVNNWDSHKTAFATAVEFD